MRVVHISSTTSRRTMILVNCKLIQAANVSCGRRIRASLSTRQEVVCNTRSGSLSMLV